MSQNSGEMAVDSEPKQKRLSVKSADGSEDNKRRGGRRRIFKRTLGRRPRRMGSRGRPPLRELRERRSFSRPRRGLRLVIRNLDKQVTNTQLKELFQKVGPLKRCGISVTKLGDSRGIADIEFMYDSDAFAAAKKYNYKLINDMPIRIEIIGRRGRPLRRRRISFRNRDRIRDRDMPPRRRRRFDDERRRGRRRPRSQAPPRRRRRFDDERRRGRRRPRY